MEITRELFEEILPGIDADKWYDIVVETMPYYYIDTPLRVAAFLANAAHESNTFKALVENLNYSAAALRRTWPSRFPTDEVAKAYERNPEAIANKVYSSRMGNGPEKSGEGWKYRGRGVFQLTGKDNYRSCSMDLFESDILIEDPDLLLEPYYAINSACWYWDKRNINPAADRQDLERVTRLINGGLIGHADRVKKYNHIMDIMNAHRQP